MGNNPSRAQHHPHSQQGATGSAGSSSQGSHHNPPNPPNASPQRGPLHLHTGLGRRGSLPHTPSPTSTKPVPSGLYPVRVGPSGNLTSTVPVGGDNAFLDPRGFHHDYTAAARRGSTGGVDIGGGGGGGGMGGGPDIGATDIHSGAMYQGLPPQFREPFQAPARTNKAPSFIAEEPVDPVMGPSGAAEGGAQRRGSMQSTTTVEEDEGPLDESKTIPTLVNWPHGGNKVYITGTFCGWRKKYRLTKSPESNMLSAIVPLPAGTHHVKFLVDGELRTSDALPTAVDSTGILINYLEVNADDMLVPLERQLTPDRPPPAAGQESRSNVDNSDPQHSQYNSSHYHEREMSPGGHHTHTLTDEQQFSFMKPRPQRFTDTIPAYLRDFEENPDRYSVTGTTSTGGYGNVVKIPPPPSLPLMLGKVILNSSSHLKDDNSVLGIPNHVVLNHLATSSIKNHVLAVSATTRYKKKYVSTILYKATTE